MLYVGLDGWIGSQTICTARAPLSGANNVSINCEFCFRIALSSDSVVRRHNCDIQAFLHFMMYLTSQPMYFLKAYDMYYSLMHP